MDIGKIEFGPSREQLAAECSHNLNEWGKERYALMAERDAARCELEAWKIAVANYALRPGMGELNVEIENRVRELLAANDKVERQP